MLWVVAKPEVSSGLDFVEHGTETGSVHLLSIPTHLLYSCIVVAIYTKIQYSGFQHQVKFHLRHFISISIQHDVLPRDLPSVPGLEQGPQYE